MTYAMPPQPAKTGKPWTLIIGGIVALIALLLCCGGGFLAFGPVQELAEQPMHDGSHVVQLDEGESTGVWSENDLATCSATGPSGPVVDSGTASQTVTWGDKELERVMAIEADESGSYTITCSDSFVVGEGFNVPGVILSSVGGFFCCLSVVLLVVGGILWLTRRKG